MSFVILLFVFFQIQMFTSLKMPQSGNRANLSDLAQCRICYEMFSFRFDFDVYQGNPDIENKINAVVNRLRSEPEVVVTEPVNQLGIAQEIAMKFFLKSGEIQLDESHKASCEKKAIGVSSQCDKMKFETCELIMSNGNTCENLSRLLIRSDNGNSSPIQNRVNSAYDNYPQNSMPGSSQNFMEQNNFKIADTLTQNSSQIDEGSIESKLVKLSKILNKETDQLVNGPSSLIQDNQNTLSHQVSKFEMPLPISLIDVSPEIKGTSNQYSQNNIQSQNNQGWTQPQPVLFNNFQENLGNQLKEISYLTK